MTVRLTRDSASHGGPGQSWGVEVDDDGQATSWGTSGGRAGRFARELSPKERTALKRAMTAATNAVGEARGDATVWKSEGATERLSADGLPTLELDPHQEPPKGVSGLLRFLRTLMGELVDSPVGAIALEVDGSPLRARLHHVGSDPVDIRLGPISVEAHLFGKGDAIVDSAAFTVDAPAEAVTAEGDWSLALGDELGIAAPRKGQFLTVALNVDVDSCGDGVVRPVRLSRMIE